MVAAQKHPPVPPRGPDPGVILNPPTLVPGDARFQEEQIRAAYYCNRCGQGPKDHAGGTWADDEVRGALAQNRPELCRQGKNCQWH